MRFNLQNTILILLITLLILGCKTEATYKTILKEYVGDSDSAHKKNKLLDSLYYYQNAYVVGLKYNNKSILREINGNLIGRSYGHYFEFDSYGTLDNYKYKVDNNLHDYQISYSNDSSRYFEVGSPFVDYWRDESKETDSTIKLVCFFSRFPRRKIKIFVSSNGIKYNGIASKKSKVMPFLEEVELSLPVHLKNVFFKIEAEHLIYNWKGLIEKRNFSDTLLF